MIYPIQDDGPLPKRIEITNGTAPGEPGERGAQREPEERRSSERMPQAMQRLHDPITNAMRDSGGDERVTELRYAKLATAKNGKSNIY